MNFWRTFSISERKLVPLEKNREKKETKPWRPCQRNRSTITAEKPPSRAMSLQIYEYPDKKCSNDRFLYRREGGREGRQGERWYLRANANCVSREDPANPIYFTDELGTRIIGIKLKNRRPVITRANKLPSTSYARKGRRERERERYARFLVILTPTARLAKQPTNQH